MFNFYTYINQISKKNETVSSSKTIFDLSGRSRSSPKYTDQIGVKYTLRIWITYLLFPHQIGEKLVHEVSFTLITICFSHTFSLFQSSHYYVFVAKIFSDDFTSHLLYIYDFLQTNQDFWKLELRSNEDTTSWLLDSKKSRTI